MARQRPRWFRSQDVGKAEVARSGTSGLGEVEKAETSERARQRPRWCRCWHVRKAEVEDPAPVALGKLKRLRHQKGWDRGLGDVGAKMWKGWGSKIQNQWPWGSWKSQDVGKAETKTETMDRLRCRKSQDVEKVETERQDVKKAEMLESQDIGKAQVTRSESSSRYKIWSRPKWGILTIPLSTSYNSVINLWSSFVNTNS